jgi:hypothetical protein
MRIVIVDHAAIGQREAGKEACAVSSLAQRHPGAAIVLMQHFSVIPQVASLIRATRPVDSFLLYGLAPGLSSPHSVTRSSNAIALVTNAQ